MGAFGVVVSVAAAVAIIIRTYKGKEHKRDRVFALLVLAVGTTYAIVVYMEYTFPNPYSWLEYIFSPIYRPIEHWLESGYNYE